MFTWWVPGFWPMAMYNPRTTHQPTEVDRSHCSVGLWPLGVTPTRSPWWAPRLGSCGTSLVAQLDGDDLSGCHPWRDSWEMFQGITTVFNNGLLVAGFTPAFKTNILVSWDDYSEVFRIYGKVKRIFQTTNQPYVWYLYDHSLGDVCF